MHALYHLHVFYTVRQILWRLGVLLPAAPNFDPWKTSVDSAALEKIKQEFSVGIDGVLQLWAFNYDQRQFVQDGTNGNYFYIHQLACQIPELTNDLTAAGLKAISESIRAYTMCFQRNYPPGVLLWVVVRQL